MLVSTRGRTVLSVRWGLDLLRQWAADDSGFNALGSPTPSEEDAQKRDGCLNRVNVDEAGMLPRQLRNSNHSKGRSYQTPTRMKPGHDTKQGVATMAASAEGFRNEGCLRLSAPARESGFSLAWTNSLNDHVSIHLFTPGGV